MPEAMGEVQKTSRVWMGARRASDRDSPAYSARTALRFSSGDWSVGVLRANMYVVSIVLSSAALEKAPWGWYCAFGILPKVEGHVSMPL